MRDIALREVTIWTGLTVDEWVLVAAAFAFGWSIGLLLAGLLLAGA